MQTQINIAYDVYGNVTEKKLEGDITFTGDERYEYTEYNPCNVTKWIVNRPSRSWFTDKDGDKKSETVYIYDNGTCDRGNLTTKRDWYKEKEPGQTDPETLYGYDPYGNQNSVTDPKGNTTAIEFDTATYTYPFRTTVPYLNFTTEKTYDYRYGKIKTEKDYNDKVTAYDYDEFGRIKTIIQPPDTSPTREYFYENWGTVGSQKVRTVLRKDATHTTWKESYFDGLGRTYLKKREGPGANAICEETDYDERGLAVGKTFPYFENDSKYWTAYAYDPVGRVNTVTPPDGKYSTTSYDRGRIALVDANKHAKV
jgi:YD repeat-containing protein